MKMFRIIGADSCFVMAADNVFMTRAEAHESAEFLAELYPDSEISVEPIGLKPDPAHDTTGNGTESHI